MEGCDYIKMDEQTKRLLGAYDPQDANPDGGWVFDFLVKNLRAIFRILDPDARIKIVSDDELFLKESRQYRILSHVFTMDGRPVPETREADQGTHYLIFCPKGMDMIKSVTPGDFSLSAYILMSLWGILGGIARKCLQQTRCSRLTLYPISAMIDRGVPAEVLQFSMYTAREVVRTNNLRGDEIRRYLDTYAISLYVGGRAWSTSQVRTVSIEDFVSWVKI